MSFRSVDTLSRAQPVGSQVAMTAAPTSAYRRHSPGGESSHSRAPIAMVTARPNPIQNQATKSRSHGPPERQTIFQNRIWCERPVRSEDGSAAGCIVVHYVKWEEKGCQPQSKPNRFD